jgi:hypothetical protein
LAEEQIDAEVLEAKVVGSNVVMFNLTDGTRIKATVSISTVLRSKELNPDGRCIWSFCSRPGKLSKYLGRSSDRHSLQRNRRTRGRSHKQSQWLCCYSVVRLVLGCLNRVCGLQRALEGKARLPNHTLSCSRNASRISQPRNPRPVRGRNLGLP